MYELAQRSHQGGDAGPEEMGLLEWANQAVDHRRPRQVPLRTLKEPYWAPVVAIGSSSPPNRARGSVTQALPLPEPQAGQPVEAVTGSQPWAGHAAVA